MKPSIASFTLLSLMLFREGAHGFCPTQQQQQQQQLQRSCSALSLLPGQGNQLAAAYNAALSKEEKKENDVPAAAAAETRSAVEEEPPSSSSHWRALAASRSFVQRVFHLPSSAIKKHPHPTLEGLKEQPTQQQSQNTFPFNFIPRQQQPEESKEDYVLYPLVGFQFVKSKGALDGNDRTIALPTTSHAACRLPTNRHEEVYGWFSPGCKLDLYSEDVCHAPVCENPEQVDAKQP